MGELEDDSLARDGRGESAISGSAGEAAQSTKEPGLAPRPRSVPKTASSYRSRMPISISSIMASVFALRSAALRMGRPTTT